MALVGEIPVKKMRKNQEIHRKNICGATLGEALKDSKTGLSTLKPDTPDVPPVHVTPNTPPDTDAEAESVTRRRLQTPLYASPTLTQRRALADSVQSSEIVISLLLLFASMWVFT